MAVAWLENLSATLAARFRAKGALTPYFPLSDSISFVYSLNPDIDGAANGGVSRPLAEQIVLDRLDQFFSPPESYADLPNTAIPAAVCRTRQANNAPRPVGAGWDTGGGATLATDGMVGWELDTDGAGGLYMIAMQIATTTETSYDLFQPLIVRATGQVTDGLIPFGLGSAQALKAFQPAREVGTSTPRTGTSFTLIGIQGTSGATNPMLIGALRTGAAISQASFRLWGSVRRLTTELPTFPLG